MTLDMSAIILTAAALGFLGMGAQPPSPEWGAMVATGRRFILDQWWVPTAPGSRSSSPRSPSTCWATACATCSTRSMAADPDAGRRSNLRIAFPTPSGRSEAVRGVSFTLGREKLGIVGESGSGKSLTARAILKLLPGHARVTADRLAFDGIDVLAASERAMRAIRGRRAGLVLQDPKYSLNPIMTAGDQVAEAWRAHKGGSGARPVRPRWTCWTRCASATRRAWPACTRTSCPAAWASG